MFYVQNKIALRAESQVIIKNTTKSIIKNRSIREQIQFLSVELGLENLDRFHL